MIQCILRKFFILKENQFSRWQDDTINGYKNLYLHCGPSTKVTRMAQKLKNIEQVCLQLKTEN